MNRDVCVIVYLGIIGSFVQQTSGELFSSMAAMEKLASWEVDLATEVGKHVAERERRLVEIKEFRNSVASVLGEQGSGEQTVNSLGHPLNAFRMLKRFTVQWKKIEQVRDRPQNTSNL